MIERAMASMGCLSPAFCLTTFPFSFTPHSGSTRWHIMEYLTDSESFYCFPCHLSCIHYQSLQSACKTSSSDKVLPSVQMSIWHFEFPFHYFNIQSPPHNPITVKNLLCVPQCLVFSFFSLTMSRQWNETHSGLSGEGWRWRVAGETRGTHIGQKKKEEWGRADGRARRKENWKMGFFGLKRRVRKIEASRRLRNAEYNFEKYTWLRGERSRQESFRCF